MAAAAPPAPAAAAARRISAVCVFAGSSAGKSAAFAAAAEALAAAFVRHELNLVFGGGNIGLMGTLARAVDAAGLHVTGVIPKSLAPREISGSNWIGEQEVVPDMHTRKQRMSDLADAYVALPGGLGTFEELLEVLCWGQLGIHDKPIGIFNVDGYYDSLLSMIDAGVEAGFIEERYRALFVVDADADALVRKLLAAEPPKGLTTWNREEGI